jgi:hypothetical protein
MVARGGWRVVPIMVERGGRTLQLYRVTQHGRFECECRVELGGIEPPRCCQAALAAQGSITS